MANNLISDFFSGGVKEEHTKNKGAPRTLKKIGCLLLATALLTNMSAQAFSGGPASESPSRSAYQSEQIMQSADQIVLDRVGDIADNRLETSLESPFDAEKTLTFVQGSGFDDILSSQFGPEFLNSKTYDVIRAAHPRNSEVAYSHMSPDVAGEASVDLITSGDKGDIMGMLETSHPEYERQLVTWHEMGHSIKHFDGDNAFTSLNISPVGEAQADVVSYLAIAKKMHSDGLSKAEILEFVSGANKSLREDVPDYQHLAFAKTFSQQFIEQANLESLTLKEIGRVSIEFSKEAVLVLRDTTFNEHIDMSEMARPDAPHFLRAMNNASRMYESKSVGGRVENFDRIDRAFVLPLRKFEGSEGESVVYKAYFENRSSIFDMTAAEKGVYAEDLAKMEGGAQYEGGLSFASYVMYGKQTSMAQGDRTLLRDNLEIASDIFNAKIMASYDSILSRATLSPMVLNGAISFESVDDCYGVTFCPADAEGSSQYGTPSRTAPVPSNRIPAPRPIDADSLSYM